MSDPKPPPRCENCGRTDNMGEARPDPVTKLVLCGYCWVRSQVRPEEKRPRP